MYFTLRNAVSPARFGVLQTKFLHSVMIFLFTDGHNELIQSELWNPDMIILVFFLNCYTF
jgi:hypothetical protein